MPSPGHDEPAAPPSAPSAAKGRRPRSERTRMAIIDALRELHMEGDLRPTAMRVAERAGCSLRTVWQHFDDLESLVVQAGERDYEELQRYLTPIDPAGPLAERLEQFVAQRARIFEAFAPVWRAARLHQPFSPQIRRNQDRLQALARAQLEEIFAAELRERSPRARRTALNALQSASGWATWEALRGELSVSPADARSAVSALLAGVLRDSVRS